MHEYYEDEVEPVAFPGLFCEDNIVLTICQKQYDIYSILFFDSWNFSYKRRNCLGKGLQCESKTIRENAEKILGMKFYVTATKYFHGMREYIIRRLNKGEYIILQLDNFYCPWDNAYQKKHHSHSIIVTGYSSNEFICTDTMPKKKDLHIPYVILQEAVVSVIEMKKGKENKDFYEIYAILEKKLSKKINRNVNCKQLRQFIQVLSKKQDIQSEYQIGIPIWRQPLYRQIAAAYGGRFQYLSFLQEYQNYTDKDLKELCKRIEEIAMKWNMIRLWFFRIFSEYNIINERWGKYKESIMNVFIEILQDETSAKKYALQVFSQSTVNFNRYSKKTLERFLRIPYNAESHLCNPYKYGYICQDSFKHNIDLHVKNYDFRVQKPIGNKEELACAGEIIIIGEEVEDICFLGYATWGGQIDEIICINDKGSEFSYRIAVSDWNEDTYPGEEVAWSAIFEKDVNNGVKYQAKVCAFKIHIGMYIEKMILPYNEKIHFFAITIKSNFLDT